MVAVRSSLLVVPRAVIASPSERLAAGISVARRALRPEYRLHTAAEFAEVFGYRRVLRGRLFNLHYRPNASSGARLGFVVAKKLARHAVLRNLVKRIAREVFRLRRESLPDADLVLRLAASPKNSSRHTIRAEVDELLGRLPRK